jgi:hypothetical protein
MAAQALRQLLLGLQENKVNANFSSPSTTFVQLRALRFCAHRAIDFLSIFTTVMPSSSLAVY